MLNALDTSGFMLEGKSLSDLKLAAKQDPTQSMQVVAKQFEAMFMNILTKSMRGTNSGESLFDNGETRLYTELLDQQFSQKIAAGKGLGLADMLIQQFARNQAKPPADTAPDTPFPIKKVSVPRAFTQGLPGSAQTPLPLPPKNDAAPKAFSLNLPQAAATPSAASAAQADAAMTPKQFASRFWPYAASAGRALGVAPHGVLAQAALESAWGKHEIKLADGSTSHNLFGIKANAQWSGKVAEVSTTEYVNGVPRQRTERFRAYDSYAAAFQDYTALLKSAPRYQAVLNTGDAGLFAQRLQQAGYATDPHYAAKLSSIAAGSLLRSMA